MFWDICPGGTEKDIEIYVYSSMERLQPHLGLFSALGRSSRQPLDLASVPDRSRPRPNSLSFSVSSISCWDLPFASALPPLFSPVVLLPCLRRRRRPDYHFVALGRRRSSCSYRSLRLLSPARHVSLSSAWRLPALNATLGALEWGRSGKGTRDVSNEILNVYEIVM